MNAPLIPGCREWMHAARDGANLFVRCSDTAAVSGGKPRGTILLTHGMGEHSGRYYHVIRQLNATGVRVVAWDLRGHGHSEGARGDVRHYDVLVDDLLEIWNLPETQGAGGPVYLYGHSLGGQITLNFTVRHRPQAAGLIITSPWLRLAFRPPLWKVALAHLTARVWPRFTQDTELSPTRLSRDLEFLMAMPDQNLVHHRMSARMYRALTAGATRAEHEAARLSYPILLVHGSRDPVTCVTATEEFYRALKSRDKSLIIVPEALHETHNDLCREAVLSQITAWLDARLPV